MTELDIIVDKPSVSNIDHVDLEIVTLEERANRIRQHLHDACASIINIGFELQSAKKEIGHGGWTDWLQKEFKWTQQTAENYMRIAERFGNGKIKNVFDFKPSTLIKMLALPEGDEQAFIDAQSQSGNPVEKQSARQVQKSVKEWNQKKNLKTPVLETTLVNKEFTTSEPSEHNNDAVTESESTEINTSADNIDSTTVNNTEEETTPNGVVFQVPQIQALWELITKTGLLDLKPIHVELSSVMYHLEEKMNRLHNENRMD